MELDFFGPGFMAVSGSRCGIMKFDEVEYFASQGLVQGGSS